MSVLNLLSSKSFLIVNKKLSRIIGLESAVLLADLASAQLYWDGTDKVSDGFFYRTQAEIEEETTLSAKVQLKCVKVLEEYGLLETALRGLPAVKHYRLKSDAISDLLLSEKSRQTSISQKEKLDSTKGRTNNNILIKNNNNIEKDEFSQFSENFYPRFSVYDMSDAVEKLELFIKSEDNLKLARELARTKKTDDEIKSYVRKFAAASFSQQYYKQVKTFPDLFKRFCDWMGRDREEAKPVKGETLQSKKESFIKAMEDSGKTKGLDKFIEKDITKFYNIVAEKIKPTKFLSKMVQPTLNEWVTLAWKFDTTIESRHWLLQLLEEIETSPYKRNYKHLYEAIIKTQKTYE
jgi:hypothetical protein